MYVVTPSSSFRSEALSIPDQIRALEKLAQIDAELKEIEDQLTQERSTLDGLKSSIAKLDDKLSVDRASLAGMDKTRGELVQDVRNMSQQVEHSREKLSRSRTEREAEIGRLNGDAETSRLQIEATEAEHGRLRADLGAREGDINSKLTTEEGKAQGKRVERDAAIKALPAQLYRRYETIRSKRSTALARTTDGTCKACHMSLPPQLFHRLRREPTLDQCPSCNRLIYFAPPEAPATSEA
jgi:predicted  nucleic acid-binding Zn-ribbon protein